MYERILVGLDGSPQSDMAGGAALSLAKECASQLTGCHVYAAEMHRARFNEMEIGLPSRFQAEDKLQNLRDTHEDIIGGGMKVISDAYLTAFLEAAASMGVKAEGSSPEGRNYTKFIEEQKRVRAKLTVLGAEGMGLVPESGLGSMVERVLLLSPHNDVLITRRPWNLRNRPILVAVDGSQNSYLALNKAVELAKIYGAWVEAVAVYDPFFHTGVFTSIAGALTKEQSNKFNFKAQEKLHDEIIDDGLRNLYSSRMEEGIGLIQDKGIKINREVLAGKVFPQISHFASIKNAGLIVVGRYGVHREGVSIIGSNSHALARSTATNILIVSPGDPGTELVGGGPLSSMESPGLVEDKHIMNRTGDARSSMMPEQRLWHDGSVKFDI